MFSKAVPGFALASVVAETDKSAAWTVSCFLVSPLPYKGKILSAPKITDVQGKLQTALDHILTGETQDVVRDLVRPSDMCITTAL